MPPMRDNRNIRIKKILYQTWYRGCKETDKILGYYAKAHIHAMSNNELDMLEAIMQEDDADIYKWVSGELPLPEHYKDNPVMQGILDFDIATACS